MPTIETTDALGLGWCVACLASTAAVMWCIHRAPIRRLTDDELDELEPLDTTIDDLKLRMSWHKEQVEAELAAACELYGADYRDQQSPIADAVECYLDHPTMTRAEFEADIAEIRRAERWETR